MGLRQFDKAHMGLRQFDLRLNQQHNKHRHIGFRGLSDSRASFDWTEHTANVTLCNKLLYSSLEAHGIEIEGLCVVRKQQVFLSNLTL